VTFEPLVVYALAALLFILGLLKRSNSLRARKIIGNVVVGDTSGSITQNYRADGAEVAARPAAPDRVAWAILIIGVLIAAAQLAHDVLAK